MSRMLLATLSTAPRKRSHESSLAASIGAHLRDLVAGVLHIAAHYLQMLLHSLLRSDGLVLLHRQRADALLQERLHISDALAETVHPCAQPDDNPVEHRSRRCNGTRSCSCSVH